MKSFKWTTMFLKKILAQFTNIRHAKSAFSWVGSPEKQPGYSLVVFTVDLSAQSELCWLDLLSEVPVLEMLRALPFRAASRLLFSTSSDSSDISLW